MARSGFVKLRRGLLDHMASMTPTEFKVFTALLMLANHETHKVSVPITELCSLIGATRKSVGCAIASLADEGYIIYEPGQNQWTFSSFTIVKYNGDEEEDAGFGCEPAWVVACVDSTQPTTQARLQARASDLRKGGPKNLRTKDLKNYSQERGKTGKETDPQAVELATLMHQRIADVYAAIGSSVPKNFKPDTWARDIDKMHRLDKVSFDAIRACIEWVYDDDFWCRNILSGAKLREKYPQLVLKMNVKKVQEDYDDSMRGIW